MRTWRRSVSRRVTVSEGVFLSSSKCIGRREFLFHFSSSKTVDSHMASADMSTAPPEHDDEHINGIPRGFLRDMPKTDIHLHLDGSLR